MVSCMRVFRFAGVVGRGFCLAACMAMLLSLSSAAQAGGVDRAFFAKLLAIPSATADIAKVNEAVGLMQEHLVAAGISCAVETADDGRRALYGATAPGKVQDYLLVVHLDVVSGAPEQFAPRFENGRVYARGAFDCKVNAVVAAKILEDLNGKASVGVVFASDEETGGLSTKMMADRGYLARKLVLILDAGTYGAYYAQKGNFYVRARAHGRGGHSSRPWDCDNPIDRLAAGISRVKAAWPEPTADRWCDVMTTTVVSGGDTRNTIPDFVDVWYNLRYIDKAAPDRLCRLLEEKGGFEVVERYSTGGPMETDRNDPEVQRFIAARRANWPERNPELGRMLAMTDARHYAGRGTPVLITGVLGGGAHSANEWSDLASRDENLEMLEAFFLK